MKISEKAVYIRALDISATIMRCAGLCRFDSKDLCHFNDPSASCCDDCIKSWLYYTARKELYPDEKENDLLEDHNFDDCPF